jgi:transposase-like protein
LIKAYEDGSSVRDLATQYEIHRSTVVAHLERHGISRRPNVRKLSDEQIEEAAQLYESGLSLEKVGALLDVNATTMRDWLNKAGVTIRPRRGSAAK